MYKTTYNTNKNIWVSASAGSGKTKVLIDRFIKLLLEGVDPRKIVCITFTKSAATEMIERINQTVGLWSICNEHELERQLTEILDIPPTDKIKTRARTLIATLLDVQHQLQIKTIHSFCQTILNKFPLESGIDINTQILEGSELEKIQYLAQKHTLSQYQNSKFKEEIDFLIGNVHDTRLFEIFEQQLFLYNQYPDFFINITNINQYTDNLYKKFDLPHNFDISLEEKKLSQKIFKFVQQNTHIIGSGIPILESILKFKENDYLSKLYPHFFTSLGLPKKKLLTKKDSSDKLLEILHTIQNICVEFEHKQILFRTIKQTQGFLLLGHVFLTNYSRTKKQKQCLDYSDLLHHTINLFKNRNVSEWIQYKLHYKIEHLLIDEAQDTNILQWQIIKQIQDIFFQNKSEKKCTIFVVGDPKQSIYSFQGTSPEIFDGMKNININNQPDWIECHLNTSYRSDKIILDFIDEVFNNITKTSPNLFHTINLKHTSSVNFDNSSVEIMPIILGHPQETDQENAWQVLTTYQESLYDSAEILAKILARKVKTLISTRTYEPSDFLILIRKRDKLTNKIIKEFRKLHIPISGLDRIHLNSSLAIQDLMSIINFILLPQDNYNLACLLKSPLFYASEEEITTLSINTHVTIWQNIQTLKQQDPRFFYFHEKLQQFLELSNHISPFPIFVEILDVFQYRQKFVEYFGHQINEVLDEFLNICQNFEENSSSLTHFVHWFNNSNLEIKRDVLSNRNAVKIMTVHAAKGLQAKYVILPDTVSIPSNNNHIIFDQKENIFIYKNEPIQNASPYCDDLINEQNNETLKEYFRLLYVALTRAKQHILIGGWTNKQTIPSDCWFSKLSTILENKHHADASQIMGYENISIGEQVSTQKDFFISNSKNISYIKKDNNQTMNPPQDPSTIYQDIPIPEFLNSKIPTNKKSISLTPSNTSLEENIDNTSVILGTCLHRALELFVTKKEINKHTLEQYIHNYFPKNINHKLYINSLYKIINNLILPQIQNARIKKEVKIYKKISNTLEISAKIDLLIIAQDTITIIDYKTTMTQDIPDLTYQQLSIYFYIISEIYPNKQISCKIISIITQQEFILDDTKIKENLEILKTKFLEYA